MTAPFHEGFESNDELLDTLKTLGDDVLNEPVPQHLTNILSKKRRSAGP